MWPEEILGCHAATLWTTLNKPVTPRFWEAVFAAVYRQAVSPPGSCWTDSTGQPVHVELLRRIPEQSFQSLSYRRTNKGHQWPGSI